MFSKEVDVEVHATPVAVYTEAEKLMLNSVTDEAGEVDVESTDS